MLYKIGSQWINPAFITRIRFDDYFNAYYALPNGASTDDYEIKMTPAEFDELQRLAPEHFGAAKPTEQPEPEPAQDETEINWMVSDLRHGGAVNVGMMGYGGQLKAFTHKMGNGNVVMFSFLDGGMMGVETIHTAIRTLTKAIVVAEKYQEQENDND